MKLKDRVAVITGSASGIGRASALEFAREGAKVVVADINMSGARETVRQIESGAGVAVPVETDVSVAESVQALVEKRIQAFGIVHVLYNNAAIQVNKTVEGTTVEQWNRQVGVNLGGVFLCSKFSLPPSSVSTDWERTD
jgi:NAD(P)-dependent dehydrogenase (short-subunit alcohol dehydrogenase family)